MDPISLTVGAKLFFALKQYGLVVPLVKKGLLQLMREAKSAKQIELERVQALKARVSTGSWYRFVFVRYLLELAFYAVLVHSLLGVHTFWLSLLVCLEDWFVYWLTILLPYWVANRWERRLNIQQPHARVIDLLVDPAHAEARAREQVK